MKKLKSILENYSLIPNRELKFKEKVILIFWLLVLLVLPIVLLILPVDFFDSGESICLSVVLANTECYGCGMTRAIMHLIHFDFTGAWEFNKLSFIVFPLGVVSVLIEFFKFMKKLQK